MKWFKHNSSAHNDELIRELIHESGAEGYGIYMICLELISEKIDENLRAEIETTWSVLSEKCRKRSDKLKNILKGSAFAKLLSSEFRKDKIKLSCPNLLKRLDNWTSNLQVTSKQVSPNQNQNKKKKKEEEKESPQNLDFLAKEISNTLKPEEISLLKNRIEQYLKHPMQSEANSAVLRETIERMRLQHPKDPMAYAIKCIKNLAVGK
jgi:hypothetical protein